MGVPKFYRWISERYPCLSEVVKQFQIPDFDNLYLDMNGIIHTCSHPNDDDPHFRITEERIFANICHYIEFLFKMIKPKQVFFMAVDGVAPRAKMNQQRGRRFRTAKTAVTLEERAKTLGEDLPTEARFDSNCITPGTEFMARLHSVLKGFVAFKVSTDKLWKGVRVYLSGHNAPGEGEHKIMEFIRYEKSQPGYNPNTRHCLYGLDADLIMLGLCSHEPCFSLLREEVKFGKKTQKRIMAPEETTFHLLHISLLRDYLFHEFSPVKERISFEFDVESIIDDFVLMSFLVGNDFIPHLPQLHIHHDALPVLFRTYMEVLPSLKGYINEQGILNLERFEMFLKKLAEYDFKRFEELNDDFQYLDSKSKHTEDNSLLADLGFSSMAISKMAEFESSDDSSDDENSDPMQMEFHMHKTDYYVSKLELDNACAEVMRDQAEGYVRAIQWNLHYYYNGVISWSWYYPHHYSPYISDIKNFKNMKMEFDFGKPFLPFQQLLAVLPKFSKDLLPLSYQELMCNQESPLIDYYPDDFQTDLNGKQQEWEAIVLIPFINEKLLLKFSALAEEKLTTEEKNRNRHGPHLLYTYNPESSGPLLSFLPGYYPDLPQSHYSYRQIDQNFFRLPLQLIKKGLCDGVAFGKIILGFPSLRTIAHTAELRNEKVKVFQMMSQKENMMLTIETLEAESLQRLCEKLVGKTIYVGWPHLREALVVGLSDGNHKIILRSLLEMAANDKDIWEKQVEGIKEHNYQRWGIFVGPVRVLVEVKYLIGIKFVWSKDGKLVQEKQWDHRPCNVALQTTVSDVHALHLSSSSSQNLLECFSPDSVVFVMVPPYIGEMGCVLQADVEKTAISVKVMIASEPDLQSLMENQDQFITEEYKPGFIASQKLGIDSYFLSRLTGTFLIQTSPKGSSSPNRVNVGLNLKFSRKNEEVRGFTKKKDNTWLYSEKAIKLLEAYLRRFPDFFERLLKFVNEDVVYLQDLYPNGEGNSILNKVTDWLKSQALDCSERQACGMHRLDAGVIAEIEKIVSQQPKECSIVKNFQPHQLFNPYLCQGIVMSPSNLNFKLFDRVVNINHRSSVPVGLRGTVIGIGPEENEYDRMYEIVFDQSFFGGMSLSCSPGRGYRLQGHSLLNLSKDQGKSMKRHSSRASNPQQTIFHSAIKQLEDNHSRNHQNRLSHGPSQPFYNVSEMFQSPPLRAAPHKMMSFPSPSTEVSPPQQFVTPKASPAVKKEMPDSAYQHNLWANLKKGYLAPKPSVYGQKLSVEELFSSAGTPVNRSAQASCKSFVDMLLCICLDRFHAPPTYAYHNYGQTNYYIATVSLPDGGRIISAPCQQKHDAALNAAEKAITKLGNNPKGQAMSPLPLLLGSPPPVCFPSEAPIMRHPSPTYYPAARIPDSFVASNQLYGGGSFSQQRPVPRAPGQALNSETFHLPGGFVATSRNRVSERTIIPLQVLRQAIKSPSESSGLSFSEWPDLPSSRGETEPKETSTVISKTDKGQLNSHNVAKYPDTSKCPVSSDLAELKKKPKSRIAANFQNS